MPSKPSNKPAGRDAMNFERVEVDRQEAWAAQIMNYDGRINEKADLSSFCQLLIENGVDEERLPISRSIAIAIRDASYEIVEKEQNYFHYLNVFDDTCTYDSILLLLTWRIVFEVYNDFVNLSGYELVRSRDDEFSRIMIANRDEASSAISAIRRNRGVRLRGQMRLPAQYERVFALVKAEPQD